MTSLDKQLKAILDDNFGTECGDKCSTCPRVISRMKKIIYSDLLEWSENKVGKDCADRDFLYEHIKKIKEAINEE